jgi:uncharacterized coiled-coil protein SlyX
VRAALSLEAPVSLPATGTQVFQRLIDARAARAEEEGAALPRPYSLGPPAPPADLPEEAEAPDFGQEGLYRRLTDLERQIALLEAEIDANDRLVADFDVFIRAQRQQVDSITTSFAALAGGVPGDGAGLQLARWLPFTRVAAAPQAEGDG